MTCWLCGKESAVDLDDGACRGCQDALDLGALPDCEALRIVCDRIRALEDRMRAPVYIPRIEGVLEVPSKR